MGRYKVNPAWAQDIKTLVKNYAEDIDEILSYRPAIQFVIEALARKGRPYKITNMGEGVKHITTKDVDICPCCKRTL